MILPDISLLLYAHNKSDERFEAASTWFRKLANSRETVCFCSKTINGFIRISTNYRAMPNPISLRNAFAVAESWLELPGAVFLTPSADHFEVLKRIAIEANARGSLFSDANLAALAISHNATVASTDRNFRLFKGLKLIDPLSI